jgi:hypothetical protein
MTPMYPMNKDLLLREVQEDQELNQIDQHEEEVVCRCTWKYMKLFRVKSMYPMTPMYPIYKDLNIKKFKKIIRHIKLISMNIRLFWMHLKVHEAVQSEVHIPHDSHVPHVQGT